MSVDISHLRFTNPADTPVDPVDSVLRTATRNHFLVFVDQERVLATVNDQRRLVCLVDGLDPDHVLEWVVVGPDRNSPHWPGNRR